MILEQKLKLLQSLSEAELREKVLIPLFSKIGFVDPILNHHSSEKGKDIVLKELDEKFKKYQYISVVVKAGNLTGSASGSSGVFTLTNQIKQSINEPYKHVYELREVKIEQVIVVVSGRIKPTSLDSIYGTLKAERLDKFIREVIDGPRLVILIDEHFSEYWDETKSLIEQRNNLLNNLSKLSKVLFTEQKTQEAFLQNVSKAEYDIDLLPYKTLVKYIANIGSGTISIDEIDEYYTDKLISSSFSDIKQHFFKTKEDAKSALYEIDEVVEILKDILEEKNPMKMVDLTLRLKSYVGGYGNHFQFLTLDVDNQEEFYYVLNNYRTKKEILKNEGLLNFYSTLHDLIIHETKAKLISFFEHCGRIDKEMWLGFHLGIDLAKQKAISLKFYEFSESPEVVVEAPVKLTT